MALLLVVGGLISAIFWLVMFYLAAELILVLVDIARNTKTVRELMERNQQGRVV